MWRRRYAITLVAALLVAGCASPGPPGSVDDIGDDLFQAAPGPGAGPVLALGHLNADDRVDVVVGDRDGLDVYLMGHGGRFGSPSASVCDGCGAIGAAIGDLDGDGRNDIVVLANGRVEVLRNDGNASFVPRPPITGAEARGTMLALTDTDNDGDPDLLVGGPGGLHLFVNDGNGTMRTAGTVHRPPVVAFAATFVDDDIRPDIVVADLGGVRWFMDHEDGTNGTFEPATNGDLGPIRGVRSLVPADFDNDGVLDLVATDEAGVALLQNTGGSFVVATSGHDIQGATVEAAAPIDIDNDGWLDILMLTPSGLRVMANRNGTQFGPPAEAGFGADVPDGFGVVDLDGDGRQDVVAVTGDDAGNTVVHWNQAETGHHARVVLGRGASPGSGIGASATLAGGPTALVRAPASLGAPRIAIGPDAHFGLGDAPGLEYELTVAWSTGQRTTEWLDPDRVVGRDIAPA